MKHHLVTIMFLSLMTRGHLRTSEHRGHEPRWEDLHADLDRPYAHRSMHPGGAARPYPSSSRIIRPVQ